MLNLNVVDIHCLNFLIKKTNIFLVNKAVKLLGENFFALLSSLLSNLEVLSFQFLTNFKAWLPNTRFALCLLSRFQRVLSFFGVLPVL